MNLYIEGSKALRQILEKKTSINNVVYSSGFDNKKQLLALVCETLKYSKVLQKMMKKLKLLEKEKFLKNDELLAQVLLHDFAIVGGLVRAGKLKQTMTRHKAEIYAELERQMTKAGVDDVKGLIVKNENDLPRYARVNLLLTTVQKVIDTLTEDGWEEIEQPSDMHSFLTAVKNLTENQFVRDLHLPDILVFPSGTDFHDNELCSSAQIILQDKASCFPAHILSAPEGATVVDCCAAPGNKTSHVASLTRDTGKIFAFDKDGRRIATLQKLTAKAGVQNIRALCQDFLRVDTRSDVYSDVEYVLVDPSCSGSGIVSRMDHMTSDSESLSKERLEKLARFQMMILKHALSFPRVQRLVYSTCSIHSEENESVIEEVYSQVSDKYKLTKVMPDWPIRGQDGFKHSKYFVRMTTSESLTNGFFVACFKRKKDISDDNVPDSEKEEFKRAEELCKNGMLGKAKKRKQKKESPCEEDSGQRDEIDENELMMNESETNHKSEKHKKKRKHSNDSEVLSTESCDLEVSMSSDVLLENSDSQRKKHKKKNKQMKHEDREETLTNDEEVVNGMEKEKKHKKKKKRKNSDVDETGEDYVQKEKKHKKKKRQENLYIDDEGNAEASTLDLNVTDSKESKSEKHKKHKKRK